jgi:UDP-N-acetylglucosamine 1-carboxyvinyltransferase
MTDWQPLMATVLTQCQGESILHEVIHSNRFQYVEALQAMGAEIELFNPQVDQPEEIYNFRLEDDRPEYYHAIKITGPKALKSGDFEVVDLRHGATLVLAALAASGTSTISGIEHIDRGYEALDDKLRSLGAKITRK